MKRHRTLVVCSGLLLVAAAAIAVQGAPVFGPFAWNLNAPAQPAPTAVFTPPPFSAGPVPGAQHQLGRFDLAWIVGLLAVLVLAIAALLLWQLIRRRRRRGERDIEELRIESLEVVEPDAPAEPAAPPLRRGLDRALDTLAEPREPRDAIEQAWLGLQEAAEESGVHRLAAETPGEFTARILVRVGADGPAAHALLDLYLRVRFGAKEVTLDDVEVARASLETLRASWSAPAEGGPR
ncbi:DUF4129 domain-containing protein [Leifsonia poae]|uniref:DUF4129 domain-containing protein n=1 Tax=Leifsonia poae TaxID=110933 RepID=UPI001CBDF136|nr:DUF4129 domain-containing protein [Leifsonia poae]